MSVQSEGAGRDLRTSLLGGLEEVQAEVGRLRQVVNTSMEHIAHQALAQSTKEVSLKFPSRYPDLSYIQQILNVGVVIDQSELSSVTYSTELIFA